MTIIRCETITPNEYPVVVRFRDHTLRSDVSIVDGGGDSAPGPHDYFDASLATCQALTAMWLAKRKGFPLEGVEVIVESDNAHELQGVYKMRVQLTFHGPLTDEQRARLYRAASSCPMTKLMTTTEIQIETVLG